VENFNSLSNKSVISWGIINASTFNLGDAIQTLAARFYTPGPITCILERDKFNQVSRPITSIYNGWWAHTGGDLKFPIGLNITPVFAGIHLGGDFRDNVTVQALDYLKKYEPIECRDHNTACWLRSKGITANFSGCLAITLSDFIRIPARGRDCLIVDAPLKTPVEFIEQTHNVSEKWNFEERCALAFAAIMRYATASRVITGRLHCALICLSFGTPVTFVTDIPHDPRFEALCRLLKIREPNDALEFETPDCSEYKTLARDGIKQKMESIQ